MKAVLTADSVLKCVHEALLVVTASQDKLTVDGRPVLVEADVTSATSTCKAETRCTQVKSVLEGLSTTLYIGKNPVVLDGANGLTDAGTWKVDSVKQTKLVAS
jgi:hypothetical protein